MPPLARPPTRRGRRPSVDAGDGQRAAVSSRPEPAQVEHHLGNAAGQEDAHRRVVLRAVRERVDEPRHGAVDALPVVHGRARRGRRRARSRGCGCRRFVEPPNAAWTSIAFSSALGVSTSASVRPSSTGRERPARYGARRRARSAGPTARARRAGRVRPERLGDDLRGRGGAEELAAAAGGGAGAAAEVGRLLERDEPVREARAERLHRARVLAAARRQGHAARDTTRRQARRTTASAIIIAGRPLSQVPTPITPRRVGRLRTSRRSTMAASLRYASESNMPVVPCDRPSQGSEHVGRERQHAETDRAPPPPPGRAARPPSGRCGSRVRPASRPRRAKPALRREDQERLPAVLPGSQPMPAFWDSRRRRPTAGRAAAPA